LGLGVPPVEFATLARYPHPCPPPMLLEMRDKEVIGVRAKLNWRYLLYTGTTLATLLLAAGARWRPNN